MFFSNVQKFKDTKNYFNMLHTEVKITKKGN